MPKKEKKVGKSISLYPRTWDILCSRKLKRESRSQLVEDELNMFWQLLGKSCEDLYALLSQDEFRCIVRCGAGLHLSAETFPCWLEAGVAAELRNTPIETIAEEEAVSFQDLMIKIEGLSNLQNLALVDLLTRLRVSHLNGHDRFEAVLSRFHTSQ